MASLISKVNNGFEEKNAEIENNKGFDIIYAPELPATGVENQICVITNEQVNGIRITTETSDVVDDMNQNVIGLVGVETYGSLYATEINSVPYNMLISRFFLNGKTLDSYIWRNSTWEHFTDRPLYLFKNDCMPDPILPTMGSFDTSIDNYTNAAIVTQSDGTKTIYFQECQNNYSMDYYRIICSNEKIDFSKYNTVEMKVKCSRETAPSFVSFVVGYSNTFSSRDYDSVFQTGTRIGSSTGGTPVANTYQVITADISNQTGEYYILFSFGIGSWTVNIDYISLY